MNRLKVFVRIQNGSQKALEDSRPELEKLRLSPGIEIVESLAEGAILSVVVVYLSEATSRNWGEDLNSANVAIQNALDWIDANLPNPRFRAVALLTFDSPGTGSSMWRRVCINSEGKYHFCVTDLLVWAENEFS